MQGLFKGLWIILVIFMLSPLFGKWYKMSLVSKSLLQAAWYCWWFSLLFADRFFSTYTGRRQWNNFISLSLWDLKLRSIFQKYITAKNIKSLMYVAKDLLNLATEKIKQYEKATKVDQLVFACISLYPFHMQRWWEWLLEQVALETTTVRQIEIWLTVSQEITTWLSSILNLIYRTFFSDKFFCK